MDVQRPLPLAIGISDAVAAAVGMDPAARARLGAILRHWCATTRYLRSLGIRGALRHALDGSTSPASPEHVAGAQQRLEARRRRRREASSACPECGRHHPDGGICAQCRRYIAKRVHEDTGLDLKPFPGRGNRARPVLRLVAP